MLFAIWPDAECEGQRPLQEMGERLEAQDGTEFLQPEQRKETNKRRIINVSQGK
jgi:predicted adenine nucleotide alpha hydrolase (AANH) superfamily ATPase